MSDLLEKHARRLEDVILKEGSAAALEDMDDLTATWGIRTYLLDEAGIDVHGRDLSPTARQLARQAAENDEPLLGGADRTVVLALRMPARNGPHYVFVAEAPEMPPPPPVLAWVVLLRLAPVAIGLGLVCYILARYITSPVLKLRAALRRFAQGDMEQRVGPAIGKRRDEIGELARDFDHMAERIAKLLVAQGRLLQDVSHELRSPLARQRVALELARQKDGEDAARALDRAEREAERLDELIGELLTLTRLESDTDGAARCPVDLADLVREVIENAEFEARNGTRSVELVECAPCVATVVPELLKRAVENVVRNALAYTADETVVEVSLQKDATDAVVCVRDRGPGVPEAELADILRPFYRVSRARERQAGGVGLGLAITERAVRSHGGSVVATNHPEGGLVVEIRLPRDARTGI
ncbi:MAG: HAMP domain-containing protein [Phycisphaerae bacterium]|nr:HAMP domain-containing protein [Phycisphaerae bacterium]